MVELFGDGLVVFEQLNGGILNHDREVRGSFRQVIDHFLVFDLIVFENIHTKTPYNDNAHY